MPEKPIIFSGPMVRAIRDGRKTQTRRIVKPQPTYIENSARWCWPIPKRAQRPGCSADAVTASREWWEYIPDGAAPYAPGDVLWVRETFWCENETCDHEYCGGCDMGSRLSLGPDYAYVDFPVDGEYENPPSVEFQQTIAPLPPTPMPGYWWLAPPDDWDGKDEKAHRERGMWVFLTWRFYTKHPSIHMPRWAARTFLTVTGVRIERLQDISEADAIAEGVERIAYGPFEIDGHPVHPMTSTYYDAFAALWDSIHGPGAWDANPWVWVYNFEPAA